MFTTWGTEVNVKLGSYVKPDGWTWGSRLEASDWSATDFRIPLNSGGPIKSLAVNVTITGHTIRKYAGDSCIRVKIEFVGDGEPSVFSGGWMKVE